MNRIRNFSQLDNRVVEVIKSHYRWLCSYPKAYQKLEYRSRAEGLRLLFHTLMYDREMADDLCKKAGIPEELRDPYWIEAGVIAQAEWEEKKKANDERRERNKWRV